MHRAQHRKKKNTASGALIQAEVCLELRLGQYLMGRLLALYLQYFGPRRMPLLCLLYYHKAVVTSQTLLLCRRSDVLHGAYHLNGRMV